MEFRQNQSVDNRRKPSKFGIKRVSSPQLIDSNTFKYIKQ
jgi:hypothetical protein